MSVQVILREPIEHLGRRGDVVKVANGYARNYLLPRQLALPVTEANRRKVDRERGVADARDAEEKEAAEAFAAALNRVVCVIARRVGESEILYGSVTSSDIGEALAEHSFEVDRRKIQLAEPLKNLGEHVIPIKVHREVTAEVTVRIVKEGAEDQGAASEEEAEPSSERSEDDAGDVSPPASE